MLADVRMLQETIRATKEPTPTPPPHDAMRQNKKIKKKRNSRKGTSSLKTDFSKIQKFWTPWSLVGFLPEHWTGNGRAPQKAFLQNKVQRNK